MSSLRRTNNPPFTGSPVRPWKILTELGHGAKPPLGGTISIQIYSPPLLHWKEKAQVWNKPGGPILGLQPLWASVSISIQMETMLPSHGNAQMLWKSQRGPDKCRELHTVGHTCKHLSPCLPVPSANEPMAPKSLWHLPFNLSSLVISNEEWRNSIQKSMRKRHVALLNQNLSHCRGLQQHRGGLRGRSGNGRGCFSQLLLQRSRSWGAGLAFNDRL